MIDQSTWLIAFLACLVPTSLIGVTIAVVAFRPIPLADRAPWWARRILRILEKNMATLEEAVKGWRDYTADLTDQRNVAVKALGEANEKLAATAKALADFQADDAATDATQLAEQAAADAKFVSDALELVKNPPEQPPVTNQPVDGIPVTETPETPVSDDPADDFPADDGVAPEPVADAPTVVDPETGVAAEPTSPETGPEQTSGTAQ